MKLTEKLAQTDIDRLEVLIDKLFKSLNIDVEFTRHFVDRANDNRNKRDITTPELAELFGATYKKFGKKLSNLSDSTEAVLNDIRSDINIPFVIKLNKKSGMLELIAKTVMRKPNFKTSNTKYKVGESMKLTERLNRVVSFLNEKLIIVNKNKKEGQVIFLAGGGGSGKGFAQEKFIDVSSYKAFDVDALKTRLIKIAQKTGKNPELANLDLRKPEDVFKLHTYVTDNNLADKQLMTFLNQAKKQKALPNVLFDVTLKSLKKIKDKMMPLISIGYDPKDAHLIWVLTEYEIAVVQNSERSRVVPADIMFQTHSGAAVSMSNILSGNIPHELDGEVYVLLSGKKDTKIYLDDETGKAKTSISALTGQENITIKEFSYVKVTDAGKPIMSDEKIQNQVYDWAKVRVPKEVRNLFEK